MNKDTKERGMVSKSILVLVSSTIILRVVCALSPSILSVLHTQCIENEMVSLDFYNARDKAQLSSLALLLLLLLRLPVVHGRLDGVLGKH